MRGRRIARAAFPGGGYDQRGTGGSQGETPPASSARQAADARAVGRALLGARFHLLGHSLGGLAAQRLALDSPATVATLVLAATTAGGDGLAF